HKAAVFVAATANDLGAVPPELLRKGRFDEIFFIDLPAAAERREILAIHLRLRKQDVGRFDLDELALLTDGFSGAELEQAVVAALYGMLADGATSLTPERLRQEIAATAPLATTQRERIAVLRNDARGRFVFAN
ncbi:MAG TPA: hypothetical protein VGV61_17440, partial [Thermoanaerobaculia bacterium]|nr:hypothetical protein [Thermoanaerobaculia bacterium]